MDTGLVTYAQPRDPIAWYRWWSFAGLTWTFGRLERWQHQWFGIDTDRRSFFGVQVRGWHASVCR